MPSSLPIANNQPSLQDDLALYGYLQVARNPVPGGFFYQAARDRILQYEAEQGRYGKEVVTTISYTFATFIDQVQIGGVLHPAKHSLWQTFLAYYKASTRRAYVENSQQLRATYFARDVLLVAMLKDKDNAFNAVTKAFEEPSRKVIARKYPNQVVAFEDVYQEALVNLFNNPPSPDKKHTAQLFSFFRTILVRRAADAFQQKRKSNSPPNLTDNPTDDGNNLNGFTDHIIEANNLAELFGSDNISDILTEALNQLSEDCRSLLKLKYFKRLKQREIAEKNGWSTDSVGTRIRRCLKKVKDILGGSKTK